MTKALPLHSAVSIPEHPPGALLRCDSDTVGVLVTQDGRHLIAVRPIPAGTMIFPLIGRERKTPTRYSVQVGAALHLDQDCAHDITDVVHSYFFRYMDHHCEPTTIIRDREVIALRDIAQGERVTFNYNTTEYDMAEPFPCRCGSARCIGMVRGARHLTRAQRAKLAPWLADYLR